MYDARRGGDVRGMGRRRGEATHMVYKPRGGAGTMDGSEGKKIYSSRRARDVGERTTGRAGRFHRRRERVGVGVDDVGPIAAAERFERRRGGDDVERRERDAFRGEVFVSNASEENLSHRGGVTKGRDVLLAVGDARARAARLEANLRTLALLGEN